MTELATIAYYRGDTDPIGFTVRDAAGAVVDITGRTYRLGVSRIAHPAAADAAGALVASLVGVILDAPNGLVGFQPTASTFDAVTTADGTQGVARFHYELEQTAAGAVRTLGTGRFELAQDVLR